MAYPNDARHGENPWAHVAAGTDGESAPRRAARHELDALRHDALKRPELFRWDGRLERREIEEWVARHGLVVLGSLQELWIETGGGTLFESEELLAPFSDEPPFLRGEPKVLIFHQGMLESAVDQSSGDLVLLGRSVVQPIRVLAAWYFVLRDEFGVRYGL